MASPKEQSLGIEIPQKAKEFIEKYHLEKHPEGGYFAQTFKDSISITTSSDKKRSASTCIFFLLTHLDISAFHRLQSTEVLHFYRFVPSRLFSDI